MNIFKSVSTPDLKLGDVVHWDGVEGNVHGAIHAIEERDGGVRTIRVEPIGSCARMLNPTEKVEILWRR